MALFAGAFCSVEAHYQFLRLQGMEIQPKGICSDSVFWKEVSEGGKRFWPLLYMESGSVIQNVEEEYPLSVSAGLSGLGKLRWNVTPLKPWISILYKGDLWYLSRDGRLWKTDLSANKEIKGVLPPGGPLWVWGKGLPSPFLEGTPKHPIEKSSIPTDLISQWIDGLKGTGLWEKAMKVQVNSQENREVLTVFLQEGKWVQLKLDQDTKEWPAIVDAVRMILKKEISNDETLLVDATYKDRIIVSSRDQF